VRRPGADEVRLLRDATAASVRLLSVLPGDLPAAIERLQADLKEQRRALSLLNAEVGRYRARDLAATAESHPRGMLVLKALDADADSLKEMAIAIASSPGFLAVLVSNSPPALVVCARSADVGVASDAIVTRLAQKFGGRGGGAAGLAQGAACGRRRTRSSPRSASFCLRCPEPSITPCRRRAVRPPHCRRTARPQKTPIEPQKRADNACQCGTVTWFTAWDVFPQASTAR